MRTTIRLDEDVLAAAERLRRELHIGLAQAVNELARRGMRRSATRQRFEQRTAALALRVDVANVAEALEQLEETDSTT